MEGERKETREGRKPGVQVEEHVPPPHPPMAPTSSRAKANILPEATGLSELLPHPPSPPPTSTPLAPCPTGTSISRQFLEHTRGSLPHQGSRGFSSPSYLHPAALLPSSIRPNNTSSVRPTMTTFLKCPSALPSCSSSVSPAFSPYSVLNHSPICVLIECPHAPQQEGQCLEGRTV